jgi:hypothetical protein
MILHLKMNRFINFIFLSLNFIGGLQNYLNQTFEALDEDYTASIFSYEWPVNE